MTNQWNLDKGTGKNKSQKHRQDSLAAGFGMMLGPLNVEVESPIMANSPRLLSAADIAESPLHMKSRLCESWCWHLSEYCEDPRVAFSYPR